jgi:RNA polymerase sigma factor (sigma-70 family)
MSIIHNIFHDKAEYDELINELYLHLMEDDARRLRQFEGRSSIFQWLKTTAIRFFLEKREEMIEKDSEEHLLEQAATTKTIETEPHQIAQIDIASLLVRIPNKRYAYVIKRLVLEDATPAIVAQELDVTVDNLYNIKKRAIALLTAMVLQEQKVYGK